MGRSQSAGRGSFAAGTYPQRSLGSGVFGGQTIVWDTRGSANLFALPSDNDVSPEPGPPWNTRHTFIVPMTCSLTAFHVKGDAVSLNSTNTIMDATPQLIPVNVNLFLNGSFVETLVTIPPGASTFDVFSTQPLVILANAEINFVVDLTAWASGTIGNFLASLAFTF